MQQETGEQFSGITQKIEDQVKKISQDPLSNKVWIILYNCPSAVKILFVGRNFSNFNNQIFRKLFNILLGPNIDLELFIK